MCLGYAMIGRIRKLFAFGRHPELKARLSARHPAPLQSKADSAAVATIATRIAVLQDAVYFDIDRAGRRFAKWLRHAEPGWEIVAWGEGHWPQLVAHAPARHHLPCQRARLLDVVLGAGGAAA